jgi:CubicO group peptidase (beta-lactamase class C family)
MKRVNLYMISKEKISNYLNLISHFGFNGSILLAVGDEIIHSNGYGFANIENQTKNTSSTYHDIGSITKQFTAAGILKLEMLGKLSTGDTLELFFKNVPEDKKKITIHQLLTHTAGIQDSSSDDYDLVNKEEATERILTTSVHDVNRFQYSNDGYTLLAIIVENVSGVPYEQFIYTELFLPSQMHDTGYQIPDFVPNRVANGYVNGQDCGNPTVKNYPYWNLIGNGGMLSTTGDLYKWHCALVGDKVLSKEAKQKLYSPHLKDYAYGWKVYESPYGKVIGHGGASFYGTCAQFMRYIEKSIVVIVLCNQFTDDNDRMAKIIADKISKIVFGDEVKFPSTFIKSTDESKIVDGTFNYQLPTGGQFMLNIQNGRITLSSFDQDCINLMVELKDSKEYIDFITNKSSQIVEDLVKAEFSSLEMEIGNEPLFLERKNMMMRYFGNNVKPTEIRHCGSLPSTFIDGTLEVRYQLKMEEKHINLLFFWEKEKLHFLGFIGELGPVSIDFVNDGDSYMGYSIIYESTIAFTLPKESIEKIDFHLADRIAYKI